MSFVNKKTTPELTAFRNAKSRILNRENRYQGRPYYRGLSFEYKSFEEFLNDVGQRPSSHHTLDRIDNCIGYVPGNCRWATRSEQQSNQSALRRNNSSGFRGVQKHRDKYQVQVSDPKTGKTVYLCSVNNPAVGSKIYDRVERLLRGSLALTNSKSRSETKRGKNRD